MQHLHRVTTLSSGTSIRVRLAHASDVPRLVELIERLGLEADDLELARALRVDPRDRVAMVAAALVDRSEELVGLALMHRFAEAPDLVLADEALAPGVLEALEAAVRGRRVA